MAQIFPHSSNTIVPGVFLGLVVFFALLALAVWLLFGSTYITAVGVPINQPVPFSHEHHVGGLGIDCRYCHTGVEVAGYAGVPSTHTCMTCHSQLWTQASMLAPVRESLMRNTPIAWNRVNNVPDYVYFNHQVHVARGVSCVSCHGRVDEMPLIAKAETLYMRWCLDCHRHPEVAIRPKEEVFNMAAAATSLKANETVPELSAIKTASLLDCSQCHR
jgi:hypothetical protein